MPESRGTDPGSAAGPGPGHLAGTSQSVLRALQVLRAMRIADGELGVAEIARTVGLPMTTVHRILKTLLVAGYVVQDAATERYHLGREAYLLGRAVANTLGFDAALPLLEHLADETGESVNLVVRDANQGLVVLRIESQQALRFAQPVGTKIPLHCTSTGKILLAFGANPEADVRSLGSLQRFTPETITSPAALLQELQAIRKQQFSLNHGERIPGVCGVAAPVLASDGAVVAGLAVQGPELRLPLSRAEELAPLVVSVAQAIAAALPRGYQI
ncbi:MAG: IclR family transcriptional regulator [Actinomycetota bacterium]|nr:IclR family transcriptional regulator [Actinomycetota bacterium]